jgi:hypothetical protein
MLHSVIAEIMHLAGYAEADARTIASDAVLVETHLASHMWSMTQARVAKPQRYSLAEFQSVTPGFDWVRVFDTIVAEMMQTNSKVVLHNPITSGKLFEVDNLHGFYAGMNKIITIDQLPRLKHYMLVYYLPSVTYCNLSVILLWCSFLNSQLALIFFAVEND